MSFIKDWLNSIVEYESIFKISHKQVSIIRVRAPWWWVSGRLVSSTKRCLKKTIGRSSLSYEELRTVLLEVERTLNNRPLTYLYDEEEEYRCPDTGRINLWMTGYYHT